MSLFPPDDKGRKALPIFAMIAGYFPKALREVTRVCVANNVRYSPDRAPTDIVWNRGKSKDQFGSLFRHMLERKVDGHVFETVPPEISEIIGTPHVYVLAEAAWRALAALEEEIEQQEGEVYRRDCEALDALTGVPKLPPLLPAFSDPPPSKPKCPVCGFREHVAYAPEGGYVCAAGHVAYFFPDQQP